MLKSNWLYMLVVLFVSGCAATPNAIRLTDGDGDKERVVRTVAIDPVMFSGLPWTDALKSSDFVVALSKFPTTPESYAEWDPLRIRYQAYAIGADGREYQTHAVFAGFIGCAPRYFIFVEGLKNLPADVKAVTLSTLLDRAYDLHGQEVKPFDAPKFKKSASYRKELVQREGTSLAAVRPVRGMDRAFAQWSVYNTPSGQIVTPFDAEKVKYLAGLNPQYSYWEKVIGSTRASISPDYVSTVIGAVFDLITAGQVQPRGFDYESTQSRRQQGYNMVALESLRQAGEKSCRIAERSQ